MKPDMLIGVPRVWIPNSVFLHFTGDFESADEMFAKHSKISEQWLQWRDIVVDRKQPRKMKVQANTIIKGNYRWGFFELHSGSFCENHRGLKSTVSNWQPPLIFVRFTWNFFYMCTYYAAHAQEVSCKSDKDYGGLSVGDSQFQTTVIFAKTTTV